MTDSSIEHGAYDPVKAREYYLRTRKLKGRRRSGDSTPEKDRPAPPRSTTNTAKIRREDLKARKEALEKRLDRLEEVLEKLVKAAKARSGVEAPKAPETRVDKADRNRSEKGRKPQKPESPSQKKERAKRAKEAYEKENPNSLSTDIRILRSQIEDIQAEIKSALDGARNRRSKAGKKGEESGSRTNSDGPKGR